MHDHHKPILLAYRRVLSFRERPDHGHLRSGLLKEQKIVYLIGRYLVGRNLDHIRGSAHVRLNNVRPFGLRSFQSPP